MSTARLGIKVRLGNFCVLGFDYFSLIFHNISKKCQKGKIKMEQQDFLTARVTVILATRWTRN